MAATAPSRPLLRGVLGAVLRRIRLAQRRTLADVAGTAKISVPYLSEVERGRKEASSEVLAALSDALHVPLSVVLAEVGRDLAVELTERARRELREQRAAGRALPAGSADPSTRSLHSLAEFARAADLTAELGIPTELTAELGIPAELTAGTDLGIPTDLSIPADLSAGGEVMLLAA